MPFSLSTMQKPIMPHLLNVQARIIEEKLLLEFCMNMAHQTFQMEGRIFTIVWAKFVAVGCLGIDAEHPSSASIF